MVSCKSCGALHPYCTPLGCYEGTDDEDVCQNCGDNVGCQIPIDNPYAAYGKCPECKGKWAQDQLDNWSGRCPMCNEIIDGS